MIMAASTELKKALFYSMLRIRLIEEKIADLYPEQEIRCPCHLCIGQEAIAAGVCATLSREDYLFGTYRAHGLYLAKGGDLKKMLSEIYGKQNGCTRGKGGSMHMFSKSNSFYGGHGIVGAQVPIGTGVAFALKYQGEKNICRTYIGDGAMNNGQVFESFNLASLWKLPVLYIIENNKYGMGTSVDRAAAGSDLYKRGEPFGIPGELVDGMNVFKVIEAAHKAGKYVREGKGPYILEVQTYRYKGHSMSDPAKYRTKKELERYRTKDPIEVAHKEILQKKIATEKELEKINKKIIKKIKNAADYALKSPFPNNEDLYTDVYV